MRVLVTGGAGFIGSNFIEYFCQKYPKYVVVNLDTLTYAGDLNNLDGILSKNYHFIKGNICDASLVDEIFRDFNINCVVHFAAESHVDNSIKQPSVFVDTNIKGTFILLDTAFKTWFDAPHCAKKGFESHRFCHISTDEVFGSILCGKFSETSPYAPNSPYSASKAASDMLVRSYFHTYGLQTFITNCSNNYGPKQHSEKLIPTIIKNAILKNKIPIYGDGRNVRDWLFVKDHCIAIDKVLHSSYFGESFNIGGNCEKQNLELAFEICEILDFIYPRSDGISYKTQIDFVQDRLGHDRRYAVDTAKIQEKLGWNMTSYKQNLLTTIKWYLNAYAISAGGAFNLLFALYVFYSFKKEFKC